MPASEQRLRIGWATQNITPKIPVALWGQYYPRIAREVRDPLYATAWAVESSNETGKPEQVILVSLDLVNLQKRLQDDVRRNVRTLLPDFDPTRLVLNAIHTHNGPNPFPVSRRLQSAPAAAGAEGYYPFLVDRITRSVTEAWRRRKPCAVSWGVGQAVIGHCRRAMYADGSVEMYGRTDRPDFIGMEAGCDHGVDLLFCWDTRRRLTGVVVNVACPSQVMEATYCVTADYMGEARRRLKKRFGETLFVLAQIGAGGDQSPRDLARNYRSGPDMWHEDGAVELGRRLADAVEAVYPRARESIHDRLSFHHIVRNIRLPIRTVSQTEVRQAQRVLRRLQAREPEDALSPRSAFSRFVAETKANEAKGGPGPYDSKLHDYATMQNSKAVLERWEMQRRRGNFTMELHALRLGDVAFATNPFELFLDYGQQIKARSPAEQTFIVQLAGDRAKYLPTRRAISCTGYGARVTDGIVGPEGGQKLVERTLRSIKACWDG